MTTSPTTYTVVFSDHDHIPEDVQAASYAVDVDTGWLNFHDSNGRVVFSAAPETVRSIRAERSGCCCRDHR